jgi:hypothetical protein
MRARAYTHTHTHTHTRARAHTHTHTHTLSLSHKKQVGTSHSFSQKLKIKTQVDKAVHTENSNLKLKEDLGFPFVIRTACAERNFQRYVSLYVFVCFLAVYALRRYKRSCLRLLQ